MLDYQDFQFELRIGRELVRLSARVPEASMSLVDFLPIVRSLTELTTQVAAREADILGQPVRCGPGCGACCRQLVPIGPAEALDLRRIIGELTPERRERVLGRFIQAVEQLASAGLLARLREQLGRPGVAEGSKRALGLDYFALGLACPFLEDESCSIHRDRPLACREYLVSSDPVHCSRPDARSVAILDLPRRLSALFFRLGAEQVPEEPAWLPLTLTLDETVFDAAAVRAATRSGPERFDGLIALLAGGHLATGEGPPPGGT